MKAAFLAILVLLTSQAYANSEQIFSKTVEIKMMGVEEGTLAESIVIMDKEFVSVELTNESGFGCYFEGKKDGNKYVPINYLSERGKSCTVSTSMKNGKLSITSLGACAEYCGAGAELKVNGLIKKD